MSAASPSTRPILGFLSFAGLGYGLFLLLSAWAFMRTARRVEGQVVDRNGANFTVAYQVNGQTLELTEALPSTKGMSGLTRRRLQPGTAVSVLYDPAHPEKAKWDSNRIWAWPLVVIAMAALCFCAAVFGQDPRAVGGSNPLSRR